ncbi:MAG: xanthine dehydrogenase accessory protein XdhC [Rhodobacterales bacterium]|jgi:xanthine dehydrogenase accessory factor|nr:xanthine dehydrogenase accessory protein XdhC [Paracoccaceae bacterium]
MGFDLIRLVALTEQHGVVARIIVAASKGSVPREPGAAMFVWAVGQEGTIGGGTLEFEAVKAARVALTAGSGQPLLAHIPLGPALGQCCGGSVSLLTEVYSVGDCARLQNLTDNGLPFCRRVNSNAPEPLAVSRIMAAARGQGIQPAPGLIAGWMVEPMSPARLPLWIYGAGHVGRALVNTLAPLGYEICWVDTHADRFPEMMPDHVNPLVAINPVRVVPHAPADARHLILTYSHNLDLELCHGILSHSFHSVGLIGSATKWARFRKRLAALGHSGAQISRITCPIGMPELGKAPERIAVGVATKLLMAEVAVASGQGIAKEPAI